MTNESLSMSRRVALGLTLGLAGTAAAKAAAAAGGGTAAPVNLTAGIFFKTLPTLAADKKGFWAAEGLNVTLAQVSGSIQQAQSLASGEYQFAFSSADNTANYRLNANNALGQRVDFQMIAGQDLGLGLGLYTRKSITTTAGLAGKNFAVDAVDSGFAYVLYAILSSFGLQPGQYSVTAVGGSAARYAALISGKTDGTLLSAGFDLRAAAAGYPELGSVSQLVRPYLGSAIEGSERWMRANPGIVVRFLRGYYKALQWSLAPTNQAEATALLQTTGADATLAAALYQEQALRVEGLITDLAVNQPALLNLLVLRQTYQGFQQPRTLAQLAYLASERSGLWTDRYRQRAIDTAYGSARDDDEDRQD